ncbi:MAG: hypothetical protein J1F14_08160 [Treponema sp.]|nr:hypothetical protein [Treponema sp.]
MQFLISAMNKKQQPKKYLLNKTEYSIIMRINTTDVKDKYMREKIGNYFSKGVKVGALSAALLTTMGCPTPNIENPNHFEIEQDLDSLYFIRHRFMEENADISSNASKEERIAWANKHYAPAADYMREKVAAFKQSLANEPAGNFLKDVSDAVFTNEFGNDISGIGADADETIEGNNNVTYARLVGAIGAKYAVATAKANGGNDYDAYYSDLENNLNALALRAYNDSLGVMRGSTQLPFNQEKDAIYAAAGISGSDDAFSANRTAAYDQVETNLRQILQTVSDTTGVSTQTLTAAVNLSLLNTSLWGARDLGVHRGYTQLSTNATLQTPTASKLTSKIYAGKISWGYTHYLSGYVREEQTQNQGLSR